MLVLCFVTAVALDLYALVFLRALLVNDKGADLASTAVKGAHTLDRVLFERYEDIRVFATDWTLLKGEEAEKTRRLRQFQAALRLLLLDRNHRCGRPHDGGHGIDWPIGRW